MIVFTEGKTDLLYIQKALSLFSDTDIRTIKFVSLDGSQNLKKTLDTYLNPDTCPNSDINILFVFDSDVSVKEQTHNNISTFVFTHHSDDDGCVYQRGIENNFP